MNETNKAIKTRELYMDSAKGIAMLAIVLGHALTNSNHLRQVDNIVLFRFVNQFGSAVFFLVSGYFYSERLRQNPIKSIWKKFVSIYLPFIIYNLIYLLFHNVFYELHLVDVENGGGKYDVITFVKHIPQAAIGFIEYFSGAMWFVRSLFTIFVIFILIDWVSSLIKNETLKWMLVTILVISLSILGGVGILPNVMKINTSLIYLSIFYLGFILKKYQVIQRAKKFNIWNFVVSFIVSFAVAFVSNIGITKQPFWLYSLIAVVGVFMVLSFVQFKFIENCNFLHLISRASYEIMALHLLFFKLVSFIIVKVYHYPIEKMADYPRLVDCAGGAWWIAYWITGIVFPIGFYYILQFIKSKYRKIRLYKG